MKYPVIVESEKGETYIQGNVVEYPISSKEDESKSYSIVVETDSYAGNFEREMCAFMTGHIGECEVGLEEQKLYLLKYDPIEEITDVADEHGCYRPVEIVCTPNCPKYEAFQIFLDNNEIPSEHSLNIMKSQAFEYAKKHNLEIKNFLIKESITTHSYYEI